MKIGFISSGGGHLYQLLQIIDNLKTNDKFWVVFNTVDARSLLKDERKYFGYYPESRNIINALKNLLLAIKILIKERPDVIISCGAGIAPPFFLIAKLMKTHMIYIEPLDFIEKPSLTGKIIDKFKLFDLFLIQNKKQKRFFPKAKYWGSIL